MEKNVEGRIILRSIRDNDKDTFELWEVTIVYKGRWLI